ncbi:major facilitator superfamily protein [Kipferlia bialata]|uniref:Major facilitator superfamily protein n=1 Tax=Kipferlia bialata TaxID=797122 RepID=A0A9K3CTY5_9EUKA|nr:major facilitator superfamily protein [Kipferlia bialata]|eukprot:g4550.t1
MEAPTKPVHKPLKLALLVGSSWAVSQLDYNSTQVCVPLIQQYYGLPESSVQWIQILFSISIASVSVVAGKLGDRLGGDRVLKWSLFLSFLLNLVQYWAPTFNVRLGARILVSMVYGMGSANSGPNYLRIAGPKMLPMCLALHTLVGTVVMILSPIMAGYVAGLSDDPANPTWPYIYLVVSALAFVWWVANVLYLPKTDRISEGAFDGLGGLLFTLVTLSLVFGLAAIPMDTVKMLYSLLSLTLCACLLPVLFWHESRHPTPIIPTKLLSHKKAKNALMAGIFFMICIQSLMYFFTYVFEWVFHLDVGTAGLCMAITPVGIAVSSVLVGRAMQRIAARPILMFGMTCTTLVCIPIALAVIPCDSLAMYVTSLSIFSAFAGTFGVTNQSNLIASMPRMYAGVVGALLVAVNQAGKSTGIAYMQICVPTPEYLPYYTRSIVFVTLAAMVFGVVSLTCIPGIGYSENDRGKRFTKESRVETVTLDSDVVREGSSLLDKATPLVHSRDRREGEDTVYTIPSQAHGVGEVEETESDDIS